MSGNYDSLRLPHITPAAVRSIICSLNSTASGGSIDISCRVLKAAIDVLAQPLADLFNKCISIGYFPDILKIAEVIPVHKKGDPKDPNNFRPISILSVLSKIYERFLYNELLSHCERLHILNPNQFGFRRGVSTNTAIAKLLQNIIGGINDNEYGAAVFFISRKLLIWWTLILLFQN